MYRLGEYRDSRPRDGDLGIPFPSIGLTQAAALPILEALGSGAVLRAVLRPSQPNPYHTTLFGPWALIRALLICVDLGIAEAALCFLIRHMKANGVRPDLAQLALMAELFAHLVFFPLFLLDPFSSFYWGLLPAGSEFITTVPPFIEMIDWLVTRVRVCRRRLLSGVQCWSDHVDLLFNFTPCCLLVHGAGRGDFPDKS